MQPFCPSEFTQVLLFFSLPSCIGPGSNKPRTVIISHRGEDGPNWVPTVLSLEGSALSLHLLILKPRILYSEF